MGSKGSLAQRMRRPDVHALLAPARDLRDDAMAAYMVMDWLCSCAPMGTITFRVPAPMVELATVGKAER